LTIKIGITGSMGMGKTTVSLMFKKNGIKVWNADIEVHKLYENGNEGYKNIISLYPQLKDEIEIDREKVSNLIRQKKIDLRKIEEIIHPLLKKSRLKFIQENKKEKIIAFEIPLLYETGANKWLDYVISVYCSKKTQMERLYERKNINKDKINYLLSKQIPIKHKNKNADFLINTDQKKMTVEKKVRKIIKILEI
jgi:dephospho-CoA kinase|tara:strand:+ start:912 stop:1496 length:585 start_codon:yes stop_codon:yes gene_type:complete